MAPCVMWNLTKSRSQERWKVVKDPLPHYTSSKESDRKYQTFPVLLSVFSWDKNLYVPEIWSSRNWSPSLGNRLETCIWSTCACTHVFMCIWRKLGASVYALIPFRNASGADIMISKRPNFQHKRQSLLFLYRCTNKTQDSSVIGERPREWIDVLRYIVALVSTDAQSHILEERWSPLTNLAYRVVWSHSLYVMATEVHQTGLFSNQQQQKMLNSTVSW